MRLPDRAGYWPAIVLFLAFAWFELVHTAPDDPHILALAVAGYWAFTLVMMLIFGMDDWARRGEPFTIFFSMISRLAIVDLDAAPPKLTPGLADAVDPPVAGAGVVDLLHQRPVRDRAGRGRAAPAGVVAGGGDAEDPADRLDPEHLLELLDER